MGKERLWHAAGIVGLACYWPYLRRFEFEQFFQGYELPSAMWIAYTAVTWLNVALLVLCALCHGRVEKFAARPGFGAVSGVLAALGYLALLGAPSFGNAGEVVGLVLGPVMLSAGFCGLTVAWMGWLAREAGGRILEESLLSFALCCILSFSSLLPPFLMLALAVAAPLVSGLLWAMACRAPLSKSVVGTLALTNENPTLRCLSPLFCSF